MNTTGEKLDNIMEEMLTEKFDQELRNKYSKTLESKYNVSRSSSTGPLANKKSGKVRLLYLLLVPLLLVLAYFGYNYINKMKEDSVTIYLAENNILYQGATRNETTTLSDNKQKAYQAFNKQDYKQFSTLMASGEELTTEDQFFIAFANMKEQNYKVAGQQFSSLLNKIQAGQKYYEETNLYQALCLMKTDKSRFKQLYDTLAANSYTKKELDKILD